MALLGPTITAQCFLTHAQETSFHLERSYSPWNLENIFLPLYWPWWLFQNNGFTAYKVMILTKTIGKKAIRTHEDQQQSHNNFNIATATVTLAPPSQSSASLAEWG
jgi:hypothetical protein